MHDYQTPSSAERAGLLDRASELADERGSFAELALTDGNGLPLSTREALARFLNSATPSQREGISAQLDRADEQMGPRRDHRRREAERDAQRDTQHIFTEAEEAERQRMLRDAQERAEYARSTEGRLERVEGLLVEIRDALTRR